MRDLAKTFQALSDTNRIRILKMLEIRPLCVCEITEILNLANSTVSKHLSLLRESGFIIDEKEGRWVNYRLIDHADNEYVVNLLPLLSSWLPDDSIIKQDQQRVTEVDRNIICGT
jgi:ArsR family transcriptional regulator, arsenate/arsenite/antimonite-responsive transcriptional repressor